MCGIHVDPEPVPEAIAVERPDRDDRGRAEVVERLAADPVHLVPGGHPALELRKRSHQVAATGPTLDDRELLVRQVDHDFVIFAHQLAAMTGQRYEPFRDDAVADAVRDREALGAFRGFRHEFADIARVVEGRAHARQPLLAALGESRCGSKSERERDGRTRAHGSFESPGGAVSTSDGSSSLMIPAPTLRRTSGVA